MTNINYLIIQRATTLKVEGQLQGACRQMARGTHQTKFQGVWEQNGVYGHKLRLTAVQGSRAYLSLNESVAIVSLPMRKRSWSHDQLPTLCRKQLASSLSR